MTQNLGTECLSSFFTTYPTKTPTYPDLSNPNWIAFSLINSNLSTPIHSLTFEAKNWVVGRKQPMEKKTFFLFNRFKAVVERGYGYDSLKSVPL